VRPRPEATSIDELTLGQRTRTIGFEDGELVAGGIVGLGVHLTGAAARCGGLGGAEG
jgi:hypothetical protein